MQKVISFFAIFVLAGFLAPVYAICQDAAVPLPMDKSESVTNAGAEVAYETASLPKDPQTAWEMLRAANGLHGNELAPWYLRAHYKTYDAYGKSKGEGTIDYLWAGPHRWRVTYAEGAVVWTRWDTEKGLYAPPDQPQTPGYPESLITPQIRNPLQASGVPKEAPKYLADETFASLSLSCFRNRALVQTTLDKPIPDAPLQRFCAEQGKPWLRFTQANYNTYFNKISSFQHRIVALMIQVRDGSDPVVDINIDELRSPLPAQMANLIPSANAVQLRDNTLLLPPEIASGHLVKMINPHYPPEMKQARIQGTVRLAVIIGKDGRTTVVDVLHSPDPLLTKASEEAVRQWIYQPYLKDGQPTEFNTTVHVNFTLNH